MTDLSERLTHLADQHASTPGKVTFAHVTTARARQRRMSALLTGAVLATAAVSALILLRPPSVTRIPANPTPSSSIMLPSLIPPSTLSVDASDVPVPSRVLDGLAELIGPTGGQNPRGAVAWMQTDALDAHGIWPRPAPTGEAVDFGQQVFIVAVSVERRYCAPGNDCVRDDGLFMVGIVPAVGHGAIVRFSAMDVPRRFTESGGLHRFTVAGFPTGIADGVAPNVPTGPSAAALAWAQWQQTPDGQYTLYLYGHYVCDSCKHPRGASSPEGDMVTVTRAADGTRNYTVGGNAPEDPRISAGFTAVFLPPTVSAGPVPTTTTPTGTGVSPVVVNNFGLGTHCGPLSLVYRGQYYARVGGKLHSVDPSWDFAVTYGTLTVSGTTAVFTDSKGHYETFEAAAAPTVANCR